MKGIVDRIEGPYAVVELENKKMTNIKVESLPKGIKEGDVIIIIGESITIDVVETQRRKDEVLKNIQGMWK